MIRKCRKRDLDPDRPGRKWCLYTRDGARVLGRHPSRGKAEAQERAIQMRRRGSGRGKRRRR